MTGGVVRSAEVVIDILSTPPVSTPDLKFQLMLLMGRLKPVMFTSSVSAPPTNTLTGVGPAGVMTGGTVTEKQSQR